MNTDTQDLMLAHQWADKCIDVALVGCGGTGSEMLDELYRMHTLLVALGGKGFNLVAFDADCVSPANQGRQRFWPVDIGHNKAEVLITRINSFGNMNWSFTPENFEAHWAKSFDLIITAVDSPAIRAEIGKQMNNEKGYRLWLDCGNGANSGNVILGHLGQIDNAYSNGQYIPNVFDLYPILEEMKDNNEPSCSTQQAMQKQDYGINRSVAREAAGLVWALFRHGRLNRHGSYIDLKTGVTSPLLIDPKQWALFGYTEKAA